MVVEAVGHRPADAELSARGVATDAGGVHQVVGPLRVGAVSLADVIRQALAAGAVIREQQLAAALRGVPGVCADLGRTVVAGDVQAVVRAAATQQDCVAA